MAHAFQRLKDFSDFLSPFPRLAQRKGSADTSNRCVDIVQCNSNLLQRFNSYPARYFYLSKRSEDLHRVPYINRTATVQTHPCCLEMEKWTLERVSPSLEQRSVPSARLAQNLNTSKHSSSGKVTWSETLGRGTNYIITSTGSLLLRHCIVENCMLFYKKHGFL